MINVQKHLVDPAALAQLGWDLLRPVGWRGKTPDPDDLDGSLIFERDGFAQSPDGTEIAYAVHGHAGPWVALVPGFVCPDNFWKYLLPELAQNYRVIIYDLRGLGRSGTPREPGRRARNLSPEDFSIPKQVRDLKAVMDAAGAQRAALIGHSMGGQIILEAYEQLGGPRYLAGHADRAVRESDQDLLRARFQHGPPRCPQSAYGAAEINGRGMESTASH